MAQENIFLINIVTVFIRYNGYFTVITDKNRIYNGLKKFGLVVSVSVSDRACNFIFRDTLTYKN